MAAAVGNIVPQGAGPPPVPNNKIFDNLVNDSDGREKIAKFASKVFSVAKTILESLPNVAHEIYSSLKGFFSVVEIFSLVNTIKFWICDFKNATMRWQKTASKICGAVTSILDVTYLLDTFGAFSLSEVASKIGYCPLFTVIGSSLGILTGGFNLWHDIADKKDIDQRIVMISNQIIGLKIVSERLPAFLREEQDMKEDRQVLTQRRNALIEEAALADRDIVVLNRELEDLKTDRIKNWMSIAKNIALIALSIIILIGAIFSIGCLAATGLPLVIVSAALATYGLATYIYDKTHPTPPRPVLVAAAV